MKKKMTMEEFKEKYKKAVEEVLQNPVEDLDGKEELSAQSQITMMLTGMLLFHQLEKKLFGEE